MTEARPVRKALSGLPRLPEGYYYEVGAKVDHYAVMVAVKRFGPTRSQPSQWDATAMTRQVGEGEVPGWGAMTAEERIRAALGLVGEAWVKKHEENEMKAAMSAYAGTYDAAGAPL